MDKTVVVAIESRKSHPLYKRILRVVRKFKVHDEQNEAKLGDLFRIEETRPLSKEKRWRGVEIVTRGEGAEIAPQTVHETIEEGPRKKVSPDDPTVHKAQSGGQFRGPAYHVHRRAGGLRQEIRRSWRYHRGLSEAGASWSRHQEGRCGQGSSRHAVPALRTAGWLLHSI